MSSKCGVPISCFQFRRNLVFLACVDSWVSLTPRRLNTVTKIDANVFKSLQWTLELIVFLFLGEKAYSRCQYISQQIGFINPRTYKQSHTPTVVQGGAGLMDPPWFFVMLQYFEKISPLVESLWCALQDEVHIMGCRAAGGLWRHWRWPPYWAPSWILPKIVKKR